MVNIDVKRVSKEKYNQVIEDNILMGFKLKKKNDTEAILTKGGGDGSAAAHIFIFILTVWFTLGLANLLYAGYHSRANATELHIKADE
jgi:hypothetical protein